MIMPVPPTAIPVAPSPEELEELRKRLLSALVARGVPRADAEDAVLRVLARLAHRPDLWVATYGIGYFVRAVVKEHLMDLRTERRRRRREQHYGERISAPPAEIDQRHVRAALELAAAVDLTARQRQYLHAVLVEGRSIEEIADAYGTGVKAVQRVLDRAAKTMREHL